MNAMFSSPHIVPACILLVAAVVFLGGIILAIFHTIRADRRRDKQIDRIWNAHDNAMEQLLACANLDAYAYMKEQERKAKRAERAVLKRQVETPEPNPFEIGAD